MCLMMIPGVLSRNRHPVPIQRWVCVIFCIFLFPSLDNPCPNLGFVDVKVAIKLKHGLELDPLLDHSVKINVNCHLAKCLMWSVDL